MKKTTVLWTCDHCGREEGQVDQYPIGTPPIGWITVRVWGENSAIKGDYCSLGCLAAATDAAATELQTWKVRKATRSH